MEHPSKETLDDWHKNPKYWKWGLFYVNKQDQRLFVDKPNPNFGATLNFAHKKAYLFLLGTLAFFGLVVLSIVLIKKAS